MHLIIVHSGHIFPTYINTCIQQIRCVSNIVIHVLIDYCHLSMIKNVSDLHVYPLESIPTDYFTENYLRTCKLDGSFRDGFWRAASLRFFYIHNYVKMLGLTNIFHIEYDNLIYVDFTKMLPVFQTLPMWCVLDAPTRCVPSFVYWRNSDAIFNLLLSLLRAGERGENDMIALATHARLYTDDVGALPIITADYAGVDRLYSKHVDAFGALFDGAAVGQYIGGVDPRNDAGDTRGFINETTVFRCDRVRIEWNTGADGLRRPYLNGMPLVNLHIHSKDLDRWKSKCT